ncbi:hypothetical protein EBZ39_05845 [bacterium]|nr:hypothetical protein [bacterium]
MGIFIKAGRVFGLACWLWTLGCGWLAAATDKTEVKVVLGELADWGRSPQEWITRVEVACEHLLSTPEPTQVVIRPFLYQEPSELARVSALMLENFKNDEGYRSLPPEILALYVAANRPENLLLTMQTPGTFGYVLLANGDVEGIVILRPVSSEEGPILQVRRLHASLSGRRRYKGIGKTLLAICAAAAYTRRIPTLMTTASLPAREFFQHLGWQGALIHTPYQVETAQLTVLLPQFKCTLDVAGQMQGLLSETAY